MMSTLAYRVYIDFSHFPDEQRLPWLKKRLLSCNTSGRFLCKNVSPLVQESGHFVAQKAAAVWLKKRQESIRLLCKTADLLAQKAAAFLQ